MFLVLTLKLLFHKNFYYKKLQKAIVESCCERFGNIPQQVSESCTFRIENDSQKTLKNV